MTIHPLLRGRWSPRVFDPAHHMSDAEVILLLEAARWAPSAGNSQPWAFVPARRSDEAHRRIVPHLAGSSAAWATTASLLVLNLAHRWFEDSDIEYSEFALYDLGQAVAHMTVQAQSMRLAVRQFRAFNREALTHEFGISLGWELSTMMAVGVAFEQPGGSQPERRPLDDLWWRS